MTAIEGIDPAKTLFVPNGIGLLRPPSGPDPRDELGIPSRAPLVVAVSVLREQKALHVLVEAALSLHDDVPDLQVVIAGGGEDEARLRSVIRSGSGERFIQLVGRRSDVPELLATADVVVSTSDFEGSPLAVMEYMAAAKPIVATCVGGIPDLIDDHVHGLLVQPRNPEGVAEAIHLLLRDPALAAALGSAAQERQAREFTLDAMVHRIEDLYCELLESNARRTLS
jgi:glycosyltransferase involved in cell wall biosynthesis